MFMRANIFKKNKILFALLFLYPNTPLACGSMGLDRPGAVVELVTILLFPALFLIPLEIFLLRQITQTYRKSLEIYAASLVSKLFSFQLALSSLFDGAAGKSVVATFGVYPLAHFIFTLVIVFFSFEIKTVKAVCVVAATSTIIPAAYFFTLFLMAKL